MTTTCDCDIRDCICQPDEGVIVERMLPDFAPVIGDLERTRQELCDVINKNPYGNKRGQKADRIIDKIDWLLKEITTN